jgi:hypothetical protein
MKLISTERVGHLHLDGVRTHQNITLAGGEGGIRTHGGD